MMKKHSCIVPVLLLSYLLGSYNGYIALWNDGSSHPVQVFPYQTASLPAHDQAALEKGIIIEEKSQLQRILEDYLS